MPAAECYNYTDRCVSINVSVNQVHVKKMFYETVYLCRVLFVKQTDTKKNYLCWSVTRTKTYVDLQVQV